jgi:hypothetical protein
MIVLYCFANCLNHTPTTLCTTRSDTDTASQQDLETPECACPQICRVVLIVERKSKDIKRLRLYEINLTII